MSYQNNNQRYNEEIPAKNMQSDRPLLVAVIFLVVFGLMSIFSASAPKCIEMGANPTKFFLQQLIGVVIGFLGLRFFSNFNYKRLINYTLPFALLVIAMLFIVKIAGVTVNGAQRWINIGPINLQPSEFAKPAVVLLLAGVFHKDANLFDQTKFITAFLPIFVMLALIFFQPNLSMLLLLLFTSVAIFICAGGDLKLLVYGACCFVPLLLLR